MSTIRNDEAEKCQARLEPDSIPYVVGIGASAGGLKALEQFFENMPQDSGGVFVVIQHLSPDFKSLMDELLRRRTEMSIYKVEDGMYLEPNSVYLIPPGKNLVVEQHRLKLVSQQRDQGHLVNLPIDTFFQSLAQEYAERSIGVVLSGTGFDGTQGLQDIHQAGGMTLVQEPTSAEFEGMPQSAIATHIVDQIAPPAELAQMLYHLLQSPVDIQLLSAKTNPSPSQDIQKIIALLAQQEQCDFSHYKLNTIRPRIQRRCLILGYTDSSQYLQFLTASEEEQAKLRDELLINVTSFFRDAVAWDFLEHQVFPQLITEHPDNMPLRVWVTACSTGEEAYSMAILIHEAIERSGRSIDVKIFATDIHAIALEEAARGVYSPHIVEHISEARLQRYFTRKGQNFEVSRQLRKMLIFAPHNLIQDVGFTHINFISCRNVLIYMQPELQHQVLSHLHFSLVSNGLLFLGGSETLSDLQAEFSTLHERYRVYQKLRDVRLQELLPKNNPASSRLASYGRQQSGSSSLDSILNEAFRSFLAAKHITCYIVDANYHLLHVCSDPLRLLQVPEGPATRDLIKMLPLPLQLPLSTALYRARRHRKTIEYVGLDLPLGEMLHHINLKVSYQQSNRLGRAFLMVEVAMTDAQSSPSNAESRFDVDTESVQRMMQLEHDLQQTRENLRATIEELETTNEEQQATNEELVASNEELQSANEELYAVNAEYHSKIQELTELNNDIDNILYSIEIGVVILDRNLNIRKFTPAVKPALNLVDADVGRPLSHFSHNLNCQNFVDLLIQTIETDQSLEQEVRVKSDGTPLLMRVHPYRLANQPPQGVVLTFINIATIKQTQERLHQEIQMRKETEASLQTLNLTLEKQVEERLAQLKSTNAQLSKQITKRHQIQKDLRQRNAELRAIFHAIPDAIVFADSSLHIQMVNPAFNRLFGYETGGLSEQTLKSIYANEKDYDLQQQRHFTQGSEEKLEPCEVDFRHQNGEVFPGESIGLPVQDEWGNPLGVVGLIRDIQKRKATERQIQRQLTAIESAMTGIAILDPDAILYLNQAHARIYGYENPQDLVGQSWKIFYAPEAITWIEETVIPQLRQDGFWHGDIQAKHRDGHLFDEEISLTLTQDGDLIRVCQEITARKELEKFQESMMEALTRSNRDLEQFAYVASHDLREPLRKVKSFSELLVKGYRKQLDSTAHQYIDFITSGVTRMEALIQDLLTYSRLNQDTQAKGLVDMNAALKNVLEDLQILIEQHQVTVTSADLPTILANGTAMEQLLLNLIGNAIKFRRQNVRTTIHIAGYKQPQHWVISVADNGIGMAPEFKERVFEIFQRLHSRVEYPGTGIGLALCRKIVENLGGRIWVESEEGQGATFSFTLPLGSSDLPTPTQETHH